MARETRCVQFDDKNALLLGSLDTLVANIIADFVAGAPLSVMTGWLEDDMDTSQDELAQMSYQLVRPGILSALLLKEEKI